MPLYPQRELEELYIAHQSVWDEVFDGDLSPEDALDYMRVPSDSELWAEAYELLTDKQAPI